jgi:hypothetical protein
MDLDSRAASVVGVWSSWLDTDWMADHDRNCVFLVSKRREPRHIEYRFVDGVVAVVAAAAADFA